MTYVGKPPEVIPFRPIDRSSDALERRRALLREVARAYEETEALELEYYEAEEKWLHALRTYQRASSDRRANVVAVRAARYHARLSSRTLLHTHIRFLDARERLRALLRRRRTIGG